MDLLRLKMYDIIKHHHAEKRVLVTSFHKEQNERFRAISNGEIATGASQHEVTEGVIKFILGLGLSLSSLKLTHFKCL